MEKFFSTKSTLSKSSYQYKIDSRFLSHKGLEIYTGCELVVKGLLETEGGSHLWTGYPGSPISGIFDQFKKLSPLLKEKGIRGAQANNEALAAAMINGSQMLPLKAMAAMKSVGFHVASDSLALGNLAGTHPKGGGVLVLVGDDPWNQSTQVPADSRFISEHMHMPVLEPSGPQEMKDWVDLGFKLSNASLFYITYLLMTHQADGAGTVKVFKNQYPFFNMNLKSNIETATIGIDQPTIMLPPITEKKEQQLIFRREALHQASRKLNIDQILYSRKASIGFITSGCSYVYLKHALMELDLWGEYPVLKLGITYPIDSKKVLDFLNQVGNVVVVEERRSFIERQVLDMINTASITEIKQIKRKQYPPIYGKNFPNQMQGFPSTLGLNPSIIEEKVGLIISSLGDRKNLKKIKEEISFIQNIQNIQIKTPVRTPTFCPGCPHRDSSSNFKEIKKGFMNPIYMKKKHQRGVVDLIFHGDTGCYSMLSFEPNKELMHNYSGMGLGGGTGAGIDPFIINKQIVFMGDSTFFHSGSVAISNAVKNNQDITFVILDNDTTAMTGHQTTPGLSVGASNETTPFQKIDEIVKAIGKKEKHFPVIRINPENWQSYRKVIEENILLKGVKVIIADKECAITYYRKERIKESQVEHKKGFLPFKQYMNVVEEVCENCLECTNTTGCPGLTIKPTPYGNKIQTDVSWCVNDGACSKVEACPSFESITVKRKKEIKNPLDVIDLYSPSKPKKIFYFDHYWGVHLAGVGGMGTGVLSAIIGRSCVKRGYQVRYSDKKGLAIRNGSVYSNIIAYKQGREEPSNVIPYGKADLLIGMDLLEAARGISSFPSRGVASKEKTSAIVNTSKTPTVLNLMGEDFFSDEKLLQQVKQHIKEEHSFFLDLGSISEKYFSNKMFVNLILLGIAYQKGLLPVFEEDLLWAIKVVVGRRQQEKNILAFKLGRYIVENIAFFIEENQASFSYKKLRDYFLSQVEKHKKRYVRRFKDLLSSFEHLPRLDDILKKDIIRRVYDLIWHSGFFYAKKYLGLVLSIYEKDFKEKEMKVTKAVIWNLAKVMLIKDELYVAHLLTTEEKIARDKKRYQIDLSRGDKIYYKRYNRPSFEIGPFKIAFKVNAQNWQLNILKRMLFLRKLLPAWHKREKLFRDWYINLTQEFLFKTKDDYSKWLEIFSAPKQVTGYREIRYPKEDRVKRKVYDLLIELNKKRESNPINFYSIFKEEKKLVKTSA